MLKLAQVKLLLLNLHSSSAHMLQMLLLQLLFMQLLLLLIQLSLYQRLLFQQLIPTKSVTAGISCTEQWSYSASGQRRFNWAYSCLGYEAGGPLSARFVNFISCFTVMLRSLPATSIGPTFDLLLANNSQQCCRIQTRCWPSECGCLDRCLFFYSLQEQVNADGVVCVWKLVAYSDSCVGILYKNYTFFFWDLNL